NFDRDQHRRLRLRGGWVLDRAGLEAAHVRNSPWLMGRSCGRLVKACETPVLNEDSIVADMVAGHTTDGLPPRIFPNRQDIVRLQTVWYHKSNAVTTARRCSCTYRS